MRLVFALIILSLFSTDALATRYSCADVKAFIAQVGRGQAMWIAIRNGITPRQLRAARSCLL